MSPSDVFSAESPGNSNVAATAMVGRGKCMTLCAPLVVKSARYLSSPAKGDQCIAATAILKQDVKRPLKKVNKKGERMPLLMASSLFSL
jgi:hypothetical protein